MANLDAPLLVSIDAPPFVLPAGEWYRVRDGTISPHLYFHRVEGVSTHTIDDQRNYSLDVLPYLVKQGAALVESTVTLFGKRTPREQSFVNMLYEGKPSRDLYHLYLYKRNFVKVKGNLSQGLNMEFFYPSNAPCVYEEFEKFVVTSSRASVSVLLKTDYGLDLQSVEFEPPVIDDLALNYGAAFPAKYDQIVKKLKEPSSSLHLYHGPPGSGKSFLIKHLTTVIDREFIFIPVGMAGSLANPEMLSLLIDHAGAVIVLEDAEQALQSRGIDAANSSVVSTMLNITDGILGSLLNVSVIATYNFDKQTLDPALLRRGRLSFDYSFNKLSVEESRKLAKHLKKNMVINEPTLLADIYNADDDTNYEAPKEKVMGFGASL